MATNSIFSIGLSGLNAAQAWLTTTSHNISNASTEGYNRQVVQQSNRVPQASGVGFFGTGVSVETVVRQYSSFLNSQSLAAQAQSSALDTYLSQATQIDNILADTASGLSPSLQDFFSGVQDVAANPASVPSRQQMISLSEALVSRFQALDARFAELRTGVNTQVRGIVTEINGYAARIADLNQQIIVSLSTEARPANDLLDQRDNLIAELNKLVKVSTIQESNGSINVFIGTGQTMVMGNRAQTLIAEPSAEDPTNFSISYDLGSGRVLLSDKVLQGGELGGLLDFRNTLDTVQNEFGRVAMVLAETFNAQHRLGQDLNGDLGGDFFATPDATVQARLTNLGDGAVTAAVSNAGALTGSDYRVTFTGGAWLVRRTSDGNQQSFATLPQTVDGVDIALQSGTPIDGDSFLVQPTRYAARDLEVAVSDTALIAAAAPIRTLAALGNDGNGTISAGVVDSVANLPLPAAVTLTYNAGTNTFAVAGAVPAVGPLAYTDGATIAFNGISFEIRGTPVDGDTFTIERNAGGVADNRNALLLAQLQTEQTVANGTASYQSAYSQIVSTTGNATREAQIQATAQTALVRQTREAQQSFSAVNLDEEAANLVRFQQAYQASSKVMQIASQLFESILELR